MRFSGDQLYQRRLRRNMSRADLAVAIRHASRGTIRATERGIRGWEKSEYVPRGEAVPAIAEALGCEIADLYARVAAADGDAEEDAPLSREEMDLYLSLHARAVGAQARAGAVLSS